MKRISKWLMVLAAVLILGSSCTSQNANEKEVNTQVESAQSEKEEVSKEKVELLVYAGAGLKVPMEDVKKEYEAKTGNTIVYVYAGSGQLLAQLESSGKGDVFIVGSESTYKDAADKDLVNEGKQVAHHTPVIITAKDNPKNINGLEDLSKEGVRIALGEPKSNAIGKTSVEIFKKNNMESISDNVVVETATVNELYTALEAGNADCAIVTRDGAYSQKDKFNIIEIPADQNIDQIIMGGSVKASENPEQSNEFIEFIVSDEGRTIFENHGYKLVD